MSSSTAFRGLIARSVPTGVAGEFPAEDHAHIDDPSDASLIAAVQGADQDAFGHLFDRYCRLVLSIALRILRDASEAQEIVQDVFLYVFNRAGNYDAARGTVRTWLLQLAYSRAHDRRDYLSVRRFYDRCQIEEGIDSIPSEFSLENQSQIAELRDVLRDAFAALNERQRTTLSMFFFEGYSLKEISSRLDESLGNTRHHYYRGLEKLREVMNSAFAPVRRAKR